MVYYPIHNSECGLTKKSCSALHFSNKENKVWIRFDTLRCILLTWPKVKNNQICNQVLSQNKKYACENEIEEGYMSEWLICLQIMFIRDSSEIGYSDIAVSNPVSESVRLLHERFRRKRFDVQSAR